MVPEHLQKGLQCSTKVLECSTFILYTIWLPFALKSGGLRFSRLLRLFRDTVATGSQLKSILHKILKKTSPKI